MARLASLNRDGFGRRLAEIDMGDPPPVWGSPEWNATNDPRQAANFAYLQSPEWQRYVEAINQSQHDTSQPAGSSRYWEYPGAVIAGVGAGALLGGGETAASGIGDGSASTAATGVSPSATQGFVDAGAAGASSLTTGDVSPALSATQDPLGSGGDPGNPVASGTSSRGATGTALSRII